MALQHQKKREQELLDKIKSLEKQVMSEKSKKREIKAKYHKLEKANDFTTKHQRFLHRTKLISRASFLCILEMLFVTSDQLRSLLNLINFAGQSFYVHYIHNNYVQFSKDFRESKTITAIGASLSQHPSKNNLINMSYEQLSQFRIQRVLTQNQQSVESLTFVFSDGLRCPPLRTYQQEPREYPYDRPFPTLAFDQIKVGVAEMIVSLEMVKHIKQKDSQVIFNLPDVQRKYGGHLNQISDAKKTYVIETFGNQIVGAKFTTFINYTFRVQFLFMNLERMKKLDQLAIADNNISRSVVYLSDSQE